MAGGIGLGTPRGRKALLAASEAHRLPVVLTFKRQDYFPNTHPHYAGHLGFKIPKAAVARYLESDLILAVGTRLTEATTQGYTLPASPVPRQTLVHIHDDPGQIGINYTAAKALVADPVAVLEALARMPARPGPKRTAWIETLHEPVAKAMAWTPPADGLLDMGPVVAALAERVANDAIFVTDAGNFSGWMHRHFPFSGAHTLVGCVGGAMGIGMPAAVAAALRYPGRQVIHFLGDGGALMTGSELATAVQYGAKVKTFISNNGSYGTIRMHQETGLQEAGARHGAEKSRLRQMGRKLRRARALDVHHRGGAENRRASPGARRAGRGRREDGAGAHQPVCNDCLAAGVGCNRRQPYCTAGLARGTVQ